MSNRIVIILLSLLLCVAAVQQCQGQNPEEKGNSINSDKLRVMDIVIYGNDGKLLRGIRKNEIQVWDGDTRVEVVSLDECTIPRHESDPYSKTGNAVARNIIIFWDFHSLNSSQLRSSVEKAAVFVENYLLPGDRVMLVSSLDNLNVFQGFDEDRNHTLKAITSLRKDFSNKISSLANTTSPDSSQADIADTVRNAFRFSANLKILSSLVSETPGRKSLLLFSNGLGLNPWDSPNVYLRDDFDKSVNELNSSNVSVYALNLEGEGFNQREEVYSDDDKITGNWNTANYAQKLKSRIFLEKLSSETMGGFFQTTDYQNNSSLFSSIQSLMSDYYLVTYKAITKPSDLESFRNIRVSLSGGQGWVSFRKGYYVRLPFAEYSEGGKKRHLTQGFDTSSQINELGVTARFIFNRDTADSLCVALAAQCPVTFLKSNKENVYDLEFLVANTRVDGSIISSVNKQLLITADKDGLLRDQGIRLVETLECEPGINNLKVVIRDNTTGRRSYFYNNFMFRTPPSDSLLLMKPIFVKKGLEHRLEDSFQVQETVKPEWTSKADSTLDFLELPEKGRIFPCLKPRFREGEEVNFFVKINNPDVESFKPDNYKIIFAVSPRHTDKMKKRRFKKANIPDTSFVLSDGQAIITGSFIIEGYLSGEYDLFVVILEKESQRQETAYSRFTVLE